MFSLPSIEARQNFIAQPVIDSPEALQPRVALRYENKAGRRQPVRTIHVRLSWDTGGWLCASTWSPMCVDAIYDGEQGRREGTGLTARLPDEIPLLIVGTGGWHG